jgi:haloalkane dehalogenase
VWRNVIAHVSGQARCLAPDLIGMGESGKPDLAYRLADHVRYLDAWFDAMSLGDAVLVGHDWGGTLAMDWAARHPGRIRGIAVTETFLRPVRSEELAPPVAGLFRAYRLGSPQVIGWAAENFAAASASSPRKPPTRPCSWAIPAAPSGSLFLASTFPASSITSTS